MEQEKRKLGRIRDYAEGTYDKYYSDLKNIFQKGSITRTRTYDADEGFKLTSASGTIEDTVNEVAPSHDLHYGLYSFNYVGKRREIIAVAEGPSGDLVESSRLRREEKGSCYSKEGKFSYSITDFTYDEEGETIKELKTTDINLAWIYPDVKKRFSEVSATYSKLWGDTLISKNTIEVNQFFYDYGKSFEATEYVSSEDYTHEQKYSLSFGYKPSTTTALPDKFEAFEGSFDLTTNISGEEHSYFGRYKADASGDADSNGFVPVNIRLYINPLVGGGISIGYSTPWSTLWSTLSLGTILNWHNSYEFLDSGYASLDTIRISGDDFILDMGGRDKVTANAITSPEDNFERPEMPAFK